MKVIRKNVQFCPDSSRVVARYFNTGDERTRILVGRIMDMTEEQANISLENVLRDFAARHNDISQIFLRHFSNIQGLLEAMDLNPKNISETRKMLIGSYLTMEYALESAAFFNPSIVPDFNQDQLNEGELRIILSFRATGEGHLSSIVFRRGVIDLDNNLRLDKVRNHITPARISKKKSYDKGRFVKKMQEMTIPDKYSDEIMKHLPDRFEYYTLKNAVDSLLKDNNMSLDKRTALEEMTWLVDSYYDVEFSIDSDISERVLFPVSESESRGIEDARFVNFTEDDGTQKIYAVYTAYDGYTIIPKLLSTEDFYNFRIMPMHGNGSQNKNLTLFPRKIKGKYAMLSRIDGYNNFLMYSDRKTVWQNPIKIQEPEFPWEFTQIGNCGPPIYTEEGWLIITHGVGPMRRYSIGASLFDLEDPTRQIGRLKQPLLSPLEEEREGYVPNVVYSCGALIHHNSLILPYAVSDYSSSYAVIDLLELLDELKNDQ
jgi:predicted GH43/DUF377 family glycosyl hydrolase